MKLCNASAVVDCAEGEPAPDALLAGLGDVEPLTPIRRSASRMAAFNPAGGRDPDADEVVEAAVGMGLPA